MQKKTVVGEANPPTNFWKADQSFVHYLMKLKLGVKLTNVSWKKNSPQIIQQEHVHFFHSVDEMGKANKYCQPIGGHFHEMTLVTPGDPSTETPPVYKCGPALHKIQIRRNGETATKVVSVKYKRFEDDEDGDIVDTHTHDLEFIGAEHISPADRKAQRSETHRSVSGMFTPIPGAKAPAVPKTDLGGAQLKDVTAD